MTSTVGNLLFQYDGKRVLVTGAAGNREGDNSCLRAPGRRRHHRGQNARLERFANEIQSVTQQAWIIDCDLTADTVRSAADWIGGLDVLANAAGGSAQGCLGPTRTGPRPGRLTPCSAECALVADPRAGGSPEVAPGRANLPGCPPEQIARNSAWHGVVYDPGLDRT
jgi:hypothetical protein